MVILKISISLIYQNRNTMKHINYKGYEINIKKYGKMFIAEVCYNDGVVMLELEADNIDVLINMAKNSI